MINNDLSKTLTSITVVSNVQGRLINLVHSNTISFDISRLYLLLEEITT